MYKYKKTISFLLTVCCLIFNVYPTSAATIPNPPVDGGFVLDGLGWFTPDQKTELQTLLSALNKDTGNQVAVVTLNDCGDDSKIFRNQLFRSWGIGQKDKNNGLLILICWYNGDKQRRKLETEVGYGLEATLPDLLTSDYAKKYVSSAFSDGNDSEVIKSGKAGASLIALGKAYDAKLRGVSETAVKQTTNIDWLFILKMAIFSFILYLLVDGFIFRWAITNFILEVLSASSSDGSYSSSSGGWASSDNGDSGGWGGFGGGSSGGGGSSTGI